MSPAQHKDATGQAAALADRLRASGAVIDPRWHQAISEVPRHLFAPSHARAQPADRAEQLINADVDRQGWLRQVYAPDASVITQRDEGRTPADSAEGIPTSSLSAPAVVAEFLELLEIRDANKVLEIGTGSGWTAALLSRRLGEDRVTTVEVDSHVADQAQHN